MVKSHITEKQYSNPGCSFHKQKIVDLSKVDPGSLPSKLKSLESKEEIKEFFEKLCPVREVFGNSQLLLNPLYMQCLIYGSIISLGNFNEILQKNDKMKLHLDKLSPLQRSNTFFKRGNYIVIKILSFYKFALS